MRADIYPLFVTVCLVVLVLLALLIAHHVGAI